MQSENEKAKTESKAKAITEPGSTTTPDPAISPATTPDPALRSGKPAEAAGPANLAFVGRPSKKSDKIRRANNPIETVSISGKMITLPAADDQRSGPFYHPDASTIARLFPNLYKPVKAK